MLEKRGDFMRHQQMDFTLWKPFANRPERRGHQHRIAKIFELQGEDFLGAGSHG